MLALMALLPVLALLFWLTAVATSGLPETALISVNVHGLTNNGGPYGALRPAPLSLSVLNDAQMDASPSTSPSTPTPATTPIRTPGPPSRPTATPTPTTLPSLGPTPSLVPLPTPTLPVPTPTSGSGSATISGQVADSQTHLPIVAASVSLSPGGASASTDANGNFSFTVNPGGYTVTASAPSYNTASQSTTVNGGQRATVTFRLVSVTAYGSLAGTVMDAVTQAPIAGATVSLSDGMLRATDLSGNFSYAIVLNGSYTLTVSAIGYVTQTQTVTVKPGHTTNVHIALVHS
jgi:hypothetical protein